MLKLEISDECFPYRIFAEVKTDPLWKWNRLR